MSRKVYLEDIPLDEAWRRFSEALKAIGRWQPIEGEDIPVPEALGRVTARPIWAHVSSPAYHASAMDGYAVRAEETITANDTHPLQLELGTQAQYVDTGDPLPGWADAVIMIENVQPIGNTHIEIRAPIAPWTAVRPLGEDMVATELVLPANHVLRPVDLGALAGSGHATVNVRRKPRVAVIPTGTELITMEQVVRSGVKAGDIIEYNSIVLAAEVEQWGGVATRYPIVIDNFEQIKAAVADAASKARSRPHQRGIIGRQRRLHRARRARIGYVAGAWRRRSSRSSCHSGHDPISASRANPIQSVQFPSLACRAIQ